MVVLNDLFDYGPKIYQDTDYFKFSLDSILLAEFAKIKKNTKVLDMCTGNAPIPLILGTKYKEIAIDAVEIQESIYELAKKSVELNKMANMINVINNDIKNYNPNVVYDTILCNPPYFKVDEKSQKNLNEVKRIARHEEKIDLQTIIHKAYSLLNSNGTFYIVQRIDRFLETCRLLEEVGFGIRDTVFVFTKSNKFAEFFLMEASKYKKSDIKIQYVNIQELTTYKDLFRKETN